MHDDDCGGAWGNRVSQGHRIDGAPRWFDIHEPNDGADPSYSDGRSRRGHRRNNDLLSRRDTKRQQRKAYGVGSGVDADHEWNAEMSRKCQFECLTFATEDEVAAGDNPGDRGLDLVTVACDPQARGGLGHNHVFRVKWPVRLEFAHGLCSALEPLVDAGTILVRTPEVSCLW